MDSTLTALPPLSRLRAFEAAARHESFTGAGEELGLTQTAISKQIAQLEADLGVSLFERRNRAVFLTASGRRFGDVVSAALSDIAAEAARLRGADAAGGIVLRCQLCEAIYWLMPRLADFHQKHPEIEVRVATALDPITHSETPFDLAIQTAARPAGSARLLFTASDAIFPVCAPELVGQDRLPIPALELSSLPLLSHQVVPQHWMDWPDWFAAAGIEAGRYRTVDFDSFPLVLQAAVAGRGVALGWRRTVEGLLKEGKLVRPCTEEIERPAELSVYRGSRRGKREDVQALAAWLREQLA